MSKKVITFGEIMLRLATPDYLRFCQANQFNATFGGGEANVAASLANYGIMTSPVPALWNYANRVSELPRSFTEGNG